MADFLLHSMAEFKPVFEQVFEIKKPKKILEIGSEYGGSTKVLLDYAKKNNAYVYIVDPYPYVDLAVELKEYEGFYTHIKKLSLEALDDIQDLDMFVVDGDHNYYTVYHELTKIYQNNPTAWTLLHDVRWPWAYRDLYYSPENIPEEWRHEYTYDHGVDADNNLVHKGGFIGAGAFAIAKQHGGERNGVKKAIEDFLRDNDGYFYNEITPIMGMGFIVPVADKEHSVNIMKPFQNQLFENMERNRIELYVRLLELQNQGQDNMLYRVARKASKLIGYKPFE